MSICKVLMLLVGALVAMDSVCCVEPEENNMQGRSRVWHLYGILTRWVVTGVLTVWSYRALGKTISIRYIQSVKIVMVEFYTPWCGHCRQFAPHYIAAATELKKDGIPIAKVNVDAEINHPFYGEYSLNGFPAIRIFKRMYDTDPNTQPLGQMDRWDVEDKTAEQVVGHMRALALEPRKAASADHLRGFVHENVHYSESRVGVIVLGVYHDQEGDNFQAFKEAAFGRLYPKFVWVQDAAVAAEYIGEARANELAAAKHDAVFVVSNFTDDPEGPIYQLPSEAVANTDSIVRWMDIRGTPLVWRYADGLSTLITSGKLQKFLWAFVDASSPQWVQWETALAAVAFEQRGQMKFVLVSEQAEALMQFFRIDPATLPQALIVDLHPEVGQRQFLFGKRDKTTRRWNTEAARDVTSEKLREWLAKYRAGKLKRYLRSEPAPEAGREGENNGGVFKIVGDTFEDVIRLGKDVLVNFYGDFSWCEVCKVYATEFQLIAKTLKPVKSLIVADFNMPLNDIEDHKKRGLDIAGFPDVFLFRAGEHHLPPIRFDYSKYNDERGLRAVLEFIKGHAAIEFGDKKGNKYGGKLRDEL